MSTPRKEGSLRPGIPYFTSLAWAIYKRKFALLDRASTPYNMAKSAAVQSNLDVDYVISYQFSKTGE